MEFSSSDLILQDGKRIYHLDISPQDIADVIITVGDPNRVQLIGDRLDEKLFYHHSREFHILTGRIGRQKLSVLSTGIGSDNIDIVMNELDILFNVDFEKRRAKEDRKSFKVIRIGTTGALLPHLEPGDVLLSEKAIGLDGLMHFYKYAEPDLALAKAFQEQTKVPILPYTAVASESLMNHFNQFRWVQGITISNAGFYGPQGRKVLHQPAHPFVDLFTAFEYQGQKISNLEMETAAIYAFASMMGHQALSVNIVLANRARQSFHPNPTLPIIHAIEKVLEVLSEGNL